MRVIPLLTVVLFTHLAAARAQAAAYAGWWILDNPSAITVCFVGSANVRADRVQETLGYMREFEAASGIRFVPVPGRPDYSCPNPVWQPDGSLAFPGTLRILLPGKLFDPDGRDAFAAPGFVPGHNCRIPNNGGGSFGAVPRDPNNKPGCIFNVKIGDDGLSRPGRRAYRNHTLHEIFHALGLAHEHERSDTPRACNPAGGQSTGLLTAYDEKSVMHYQRLPGEFPGCPAIAGNYSDAGLSFLDRVALGALYPKSFTLADVNGVKRAPRAGSFSLKTIWEAQGLVVSVFVRSWSWKVDGMQASTSSTMSLRAANMSVGNHALSLSATDIFGRVHSYNGVLTVTP